jgi:superfamily II DNA or RNA helicase
VSQWAVCIAKPSDIGGDDAGYNLSELRTHRHIVVSTNDTAPKGKLFNTIGLSATNIHEEKRLTAGDRCQKAIDIASQHDGPVVIWCDTNYEADELTTRLASCVEVRGSMSDSQKESLLSGFQTGKHRVLVTKPEIAGFGSNWQHCSCMIFAGLSYSFEKYYQAVRRCWRFGQTQPVDVHIILADSESAIQSAIARKESDFDMMRLGMAKAMREATLDQFGLREGKSSYKSTGKFPLPGFLRSNTNAG